jgi:protein phosphatase
MIDRWHYTHAGKTLGPVDVDELIRLATVGQLAPADLLWPEGCEPDLAIEVDGVLDFSNLPTTTPVPTWLADVKDALQSSFRKKKGVPDWLSDVDATTPKRQPAPAQKPIPASVPAVAQPVTPPCAPGPCHLTIGGATSVGRGRERNEDRFQTCQWSWNDSADTHEVAVLVVADGMGGGNAGDEAAVLTVQTVMSHLSPLTLRIASGLKRDGGIIAAAVEKSLREANRVVHQQANSEARYKGMGATAAVVVIWDGWAFFSHVGDCRVYLCRGAKLSQLTEDQTLVARMVALGQLTAEEATHHEARNEVTQAIGTRPAIEPSRSDHALARGDFLVLACDGLTAHLETPIVQQVLNRPGVTAQYGANQLVTMADEAGGSDNCTVVVAHFA